MSPGWIDSLARSYYGLFASVVPGKWSSLDGFAAYAAYQGAFLDRVHALKETLDQKGRTPDMLAPLIGNPSSLRWAFISLLREYSALSDKELYRAKAKAVFGWLEVLLESVMKEDVWAEHANRFHSSGEVSGVLDSVPWIAGEDAVRNVGKLYVGCASLAFALYRDFFPQDAHEVFGPYDASSKFGEGSLLVIKHFTKLKPVELWPETAGFPYREVKIYQVLKGVRFSCQLIGMHSDYDGPVVPNTAAVAIEIDGKFVGREEIAGIAAKVAQYAVDYSHLYEKLDLERAKRLFVEWGCYQFIRLFEAAGMDWRPTPEMLAPIMKADIRMGVTLDSMPPYEEFASSKEWEIYWLKNLYS